MAKKILIVENDHSINKMVKIIMEAKDHVVIEAFDGIKGLELMKEKKPDLVILDILMPGKDGFEVLKEKANDEEIKDIPVIIFSVLKEEKDIKLAMDLGAKRYLCKYLVKPELLLQVIEEFL